ncbi:AAA family ATPase [Methanopyrus kandleri]|uniref:MoxR family ATPase n=1 Tax=Methanopyrus kandleri TaxID=2320 RepID=A0A832SU72_9EURY|nr:MoxR family ATPase [Methanopyrus kandleri]HII70362.1 MoxR family ATPase [Methanopyrus kandleri]
MSKIIMRPQVTIEDDWIIFEGEEGFVRLPKDPYKVIEDFEEYGYFFDEEHRRDFAAMYMTLIVEQTPVLLVGPPGTGKTKLVRLIGELYDVPVVVMRGHQEAREQEFIGGVDVAALPVADKIAEEYTEVGNMEYEEAIEALKEFIYVGGYLKDVVNDARRRGACLFFIDEVNRFPGYMIPTLIHIFEKDTEVIYIPHSPIDFGETGAIMRIGALNPEGKGTTNFDEALLRRVELVPWGEYDVEIYKRIAIESARQIIELTKMAEEVLEDLASLIKDMGKGVDVAKDVAQTVAIGIKMGYDVDTVARNVANKILGDMLLDSEKAEEFEARRNALERKIKEKLKPVFKS